MQLKDKMPLTKLLHSLLLAADGQPISLRRICDILSGRGYGMLVTLFSLPFCLPVTIPGTSTLFGLLLAFLGMRVAFAKHPWWPSWILDKVVSFEGLHLVVSKMLVVANVLQKVLKPRLVVLVVHPVIHRLHGLLIFVLSLLLALPLPIPLTNILTAVPIFCLGLGLLEDDGVAVIVAYVLAFVCFAAFGALFWLGSIGLHKVVS